MALGTTDQQIGGDELPLHVMPVSLCKAKMSAGNMIDPHDSLNIPMKHYVFGMRHAILVVTRVHIQTLIYSKPCC